MRFVHSFLIRRTAGDIRKIPEQNQKPQINSRMTYKNIIKTKNSYKNYVKNYIFSKPVPVEFCLTIVRKFRKYE